MLNLLQSPHPPQGLGWGGETEEAVLLVNAPPAQAPNHVQQSPGAERGGEGATELQKSGAPGHGLN